MSDDAKTLIHALLCNPDGKCSRPDCTPEVAQMKEALKAMESHAVDCTVGVNMPGRRKKQDCLTCAKWRQLQKLRERFMRQLLQASSRKKRTVEPQEGGDGPPRLLKRQVTMVLQSVEDELGLDLSLLPQLVNTELMVHRRRKAAKEANKPTPAAGASAASALAPVARKRSRSSEEDVTSGAEASTSCKGKTAKKGEDDARKERLEQMITEGARLAQAPSGKNAAGRKLDKAAVRAAEEEPHDGEEAVVDDYPPTEGMHIAFDKSRGKAAALPDTFNPICTARPPKKSNVAEVTAVHDNGSCDATLVCNAIDTDCSSKCKCGAGTEVRGLFAPQRQIVCSGCLTSNLPHTLPKLRCCGCDQLQPAGTAYRRAPPVGDSHADVTLCVPCFDKLFSADEVARTQLLGQLLDEAAKLRAADFAALTWQPEDEREFDDFVQCTECDRWYHFVCGMYPAVEQLPRGWRMEAELFVCKACLPSAPAIGKALAQRAKLTELQDRRAAELPTCVLSDMIESDLAEALEARGVTTEKPIVVRVVSRKRMLFEAVKELKQRYGRSGYADEFPYLSQAIFVFQEVGGRDVCLFTVYTQEYDEDCPPPNTNRTYISYVDSVPYLESDPPGARSTVYHTVLGGYLRYAAACGFEHAHLWVAPPTEGTEYFFHCRPDDGRPPMDTPTLRKWYEKLLTRAKEQGIVRAFSDLHEYTAELTSVRDFPFFDGDFFPDKVHDVIEKAKQPPPPPPAAKGKAKAKAGGPPMLKRSETLAIADGMRREASGSTEYAFLVAELAPPAEVMHVPRERHIGPHELVDDREHFLEMCMSRHWQCDELRRAQWTTMMMLAALGGQPGRG